MSSGQLSLLQTPSPLNIFLIMQTRIFYLIIFSLVNSIAFGQDSINQHYSIKFSTHRSDLSKQAKLTLDSVALLMNRQPTLYCILIKYCQTENQKDNIATWDRASKTIIYLITKGIDQNRFYFNYGADNSNCNTIDFLFTTEKADQPLPHPKLPKKA